MCETRIQHVPNVCLKHKDDMKCVNDSSLRQSAHYKVKLRSNSIRMMAIHGLVVWLG